MTDKPSFVLIKKGTKRQVLSSKMQNHKEPESETKNTMKKWISALLFFVIFILSGCNNAVSSPKTEYPPIVLTGTDSEEPGSNNRSPLPPKQAITKIHCIQPASHPVFLDGKNGCVLACWTDFETTVTHLRLIHISDNTILASLDLDGYLDLFCECFQDGGFLLRDGVNNQWILLSPELTELSRFSTECPDGFFSHDRRSFYHLKDHVLFCSDTVSGNTKPVELEYDLRFNQIVSYHPAKNILALHMLTSPFTSDCGTVILNLDTGKLTMMTDTLYQVSFGKETTKFTYFDEQVMASQLIYSGKKDAMLLSTAALSKHNELSSINGADYLLGIGANTELYRLSEQVSSCSLEQNGVVGALRNVSWIDESCTLIGSVCQDTEVSIFAIYPELLTFRESDQAQKTEAPISVDKKLPERYFATLSGSLPADPLLSLRELANQIEETYGVRILLSSQGKELADACIHKLILTESMKTAEEAGCIEAFLHALEESLASYPVGFFRQFRNSVGEGGICFLPVKEIVNSNGYVGIFYEECGWSVIALNVQVGGLFGSICHEVWHATENKLIHDDPALFTDKDWRQFNPDGFCYNEDGGMADFSPFHWTLFDGHNSGVYFIDGYGRTNGMEDRARIMEYVMSQPSYHDQIKASPALVNKLNYMCRAVNKCFDTSSWKNTPWQIFLDF